MYQPLQASPLFKGLDANAIERIIAETPHAIKTFTKKSLLALSGEEVTQAMLLLKGKLQGEMLDFSGNSLKIEELNPPQMVAAAFLFGQQSRFPVNLSALADGELLSIKKRDFTAMLSREPQVLNNYLNIVSSKAQFLSRKITFLKFKTIREKLAFFLLQHVKQGIKSIELQQSQTSLAELFGVARPSLARTIGEMETEGVLSWNRRTVEILAPEKLREILSM